MKFHRQPQFKRSRTKSRLAVWCLSTLTLVNLWWSTLAFAFDLPPAWLDSLKESGTVRVLVVLNVPFQPEGMLVEADAIVTQRAEIAQAQQALLESLQPSGNAETRFETIPVLVMAATEATLTQLQESPFVLDVQLDAPDETMAGQTIADQLKELERVYESSHSYAVVTAVTVSPASAQAGDVREWMVANLQSVGITVARGEESSSGRQVRASIAVLCGKAVSLGSKIVAPCGGTTAGSAATPGTPVAPTPGTLAANLAAFNFDAPGSGYWSGTQPAFSVYNSLYVLGNVFLGDFNGDGKTDLAGYTGSNGVWHVSLSSGSNFQAPGSGAWNGHSGGASNNIVGDFNGDGKTDIAGYTGNNGLWHVCLSTGNNFSCSFWNGHSGGVSDNIVGDFNGDGKTDIAGYTGNNGLWHVCLSTGNNFSCSFWNGHSGGVTSNIVGDFNGDGKTDIAGYTGSNGLWHVCLSTGNNFSCSFWNGHSGGAANNIVGDFNGDGKTDIAGYTGSNGLWHVCLSTGNNFSCSFWNGHAGGITNNAVGDFNGDGKTDIAGYTGVTFTWHVCLSTGNNFSCFLSQAHDGHPANNLTGDFNGDGRSDLAGYTGTSNTWHVTLSNASQSKVTLTVTKTGTGQGQLTSSDATLNCGTTCQSDYAQNSTVTLTATPTTGSTFTQWSGACSGTSATTTVTLDQAKTCTATFAKVIPKYTLTVSKTGTGMGDITGTGLTCGTDCTEDYVAKTPVTLSATPATGSKFVSWGGNCTGTTTTTTVTMNQAKSCTANFIPANVTSYTLTVAKTGTGKGTIRAQVSGQTVSLTCNATCATGSYDYPLSSVVNVTATAAKGSVFKGWSCDGNYRQTGTLTLIKVTMEVAMTCTAEFQ